MKRSAAITVDPNGVSPGPDPNPAKRLKLDASKWDVRPIGELPGPVILDIPLVSVKGKGVKLVLGIRPERRDLLGEHGRRRGAVSVVGEGASSVYCQGGGGD